MDKSDKEQCSENDISTNEPVNNALKRASAKKTIEKYFYQLTEGCGNPKCKNEVCASSGLMEPTILPNDAAAKAIQIFKASQDTKLCPEVAAPNDSQDAYLPLTGEDFSIIKLLNEENLPNLLNDTEKQCGYLKLTEIIKDVFASYDKLNMCFYKKCKKPANSDKITKEHTTSTTTLLNKEDLKSLEGENEKDEDTSTAPDVEMIDADELKDNLLNLDDTKVDFDRLRRTMKAILKIEDSNNVSQALNTAFNNLSIIMGIDISFHIKKLYISDMVDTFIIVFEIISMAPTEFVDNALKHICRAASNLPTWAAAKMARIWAKHCKVSLQTIIEMLQQQISLNVITGTYERYASCVEEDDVITETTKVLKILFYANILAGTLEDKENLSSNLPTEEGSAVPSSSDELFYYEARSAAIPKFALELEYELGITVLDSRKPLVPFEEFYNEPLCDVIEMDNDYLYYKQTLNNPLIETRVTFLLYSFILTPATKILALYFDSRIRMYSEHRSTLYMQSRSSGAEALSPYLKLKVRRDNLITDALIELEMIAMSNAKDLKKQLVVEFMGEDGIDQGGLSKEFFQLVVEELFNPDFGMFIYQENTKTYWFNSSSFENEAQFTLIGIILGLAIYNNIILAVNFPMVVYRKLMGRKGTFYDLADWDPLLHSSLSSMLSYENNDMEEVFMQTFRISYRDMFGNLIDVDLVPEGGDVFVTQNNKFEFVKLYTDFLLNKSIETPFAAFKKGFEMVTDESPLTLLFRPEEIELLVCGSKKFDFDELEKSTNYDGGYTEKSQTIIDFWNIVHSLPMDAKKKLLEFTTGSDRVPVGGLSRLKLIISRNGPDSDRLPTSHTCFNVLLLPEYENKLKLQDRLIKAIDYSKGFGML